MILEIRAGRGEMRHDGKDLEVVANEVANETLRGMDSIDRMKVLKQLEI